MLSKTGQVWRHLLVGTSDEGQRRWDSVSALAGELRLGVSTVHRALVYPAEIGAVAVRSSGGLRVLDPGRLLMVWAGRRRLSADVMKRFLVGAAAPEVERAITSGHAVLGGFGAMVASMGANTTADYGTVLVYGDPKLRRLPAVRDGGRRTEVVVLQPDPLLDRYGSTTPLVQAWVDLFNLPGWQAARFVHQLMPFLVAGAVSESPSDHLFVTADADGS